jgi:hypothetical protein
MSKDRLYGSLDGTTLEWTDGVVTSLLRKIIDNQKGESDRRHWIVFDGDVDVSINDIRFDQSVYPVLILCFSPFSAGMG